MNLDGGIKAVFLFGEMKAVKIGRDLTLRHQALRAGCLGYES